MRFNFTRNIGRVWSLFFVSCFACGAFALNNNHKQPTPNSWGQVKMTTPTVVGDKNNKKEAMQLAQTIEAFWTAWLEQDQVSALYYLREDVLYTSQQTSTRATNRQEMATLLQKEWSAYERPEGIIAMNMEITDFEIEIRGNAAKVHYWVQSVGGVRWKFDDQAFICQFFKKVDHMWQLAYHCDSWGLHYTKGEKATFEFDYVYPVKNLQRAVAFYTPLLGTPEASTKERVTYSLEGGRFHLSTSTLDNYAKIEEGLPAGYAIFKVADIAEERNKLEDFGLPVLHSTTLNEKDPLIVFEDPAGNIFAMTTPSFDAAASQAPRVVANLPKSEAGQWSKKLIEALATTDRRAIEPLLQSSALWFDDTRTQYLGTAIGTEAIMNLIEQDWQYFDHSAKGIAVEFKTDAFVERSIGPWTLASFQLTKKGLGNHTFKETSWVSWSFDTTQQLCAAVTTRANTIDALVSELDYVAYPVESLNTAQNFYSKVLKLGKPYKDTGWRGYWSTNAVFGIYEVERKRDLLPRPRLANGYVSFWVDSVEKTYQYLQEQGVTFPQIPAINDNVGIDKQQGYTQILATDSEGNVVVFTEYMGRVGR